VVRNRPNVRRRLLPAIAGFVLAIQFAAAAATVSPNRTGVSAAQPALPDYPVVTVTSDGRQTWRERLPAADCADNIRITGKTADEVCFTTYETGSVVQRTTDNNMAAGPDANRVAGLETAYTCSLPSWADKCGYAWIKSSSILLGIPFSFTTTAGWAGGSYYADLLWQWVDCTHSTFGFTLTVTWCGAYPAKNTRYWYGDTNAGQNVKVSALWDGSLISNTHGHRFSVKPWNGYVCCTQQW
jgi:hypothetical protein